MEMAYTSAFALGVALACPERKVLVVEGEGSFYAGSTALSTITRMRPRNLTVLVTDNGVWGTGDGQEPSATSCGLDLVKLALAAGWDSQHVHQCDEQSELHARLFRALEQEGPHFIVGKTDPAQDAHIRSSAHRPRPLRHALESIVLMRQDLNRNRS
jgi:thiamine pyrophosphate-dependent acetolactate synthase large subunit-like protein